MTAVDESSKLVALTRARDRLEAALAVDESWQALRRCSAGAAASRFEAMLQTNPLYRAWKNVNAAIEARRAADPVGTQQTPAAAGDRPAARTLVGERDTERLNRASATPPAAADPGRARPGEAERQQARVRSAEASVSFIARTPALPRPLPEREQPQPGLPHCDASGSSAEKAGGSGGAANGGPLPATAAAEEAEVSVVSVDARRHADAVARLLRALHGDRDPE